VLVSAIALMIFVRQERLSGTARWLPLIAVVTVAFPSRCHFFFTCARASEARQ
jgi:hypothetical protein